MKLSRRVAAVLVCVIAVAPSASAQVAAGVQTGLTNGPDQVFAGVHVESKPIAGAWRVRPSLNIGVGQKLTLVSGLFDLLYRIPVAGTEWSIQAGGGPAVHVTSRKGPYDSQTDGGMSFVLGAVHAKGLFADVRLSRRAGPDLAFTLGYTFR